MTDDPVEAPDALSPDERNGADFLRGFIPEEEYARRRGVTVRTCQRDRQLRKAPPYVQFGRRVFYRGDAVRDWLVKNERAHELRPDTQRVGGGRSVRGWSRR